jgi:serine/threonine protein kinase
MENVIHCATGKVEVYKDYVLKYSNAAYVDDFLTECMVMLNSNHHPHLGEILELSHNGDSYTMKMPRYAKVLFESMELTFQVVWDVVSALVYMHEELDMVHLDIHDANICITEQGRGVLIDYGHANSREVNDMGGMYVISFRPPEMYPPSFDQGYSTSDIWALGMMWLEYMGIYVVTTILPILYQHLKSNCTSSCFRKKSWGKLIDKAVKTSPTRGKGDFGWVIYELYKDKEEMYLEFLDRVIDQHSSDVREVYYEVIRHMIRYDVGIRFTSRQLFECLRAFKNTHQFECHEPVLYVKPDERDRIECDLTPEQMCIMSAVRHERADKPFMSHFIRLGLLTAENGRQYLAAYMALKGRKSEFINKSCVINVILHWFAKGLE